MKLNKLLDFIFKLNTTFTELLNNNKLENESCFELPIYFLLKN